MLTWILSLLVSVFWWCVDFVVQFAKRNPVVVALTLVAIARMFGTTVQTGWAGVLFSFGRARKVLEPGFHPLIPIVQGVRKTPVRSITLDLPRQRVTTADDLVYDVNTTIVYRVEDPITALTAVQDVRQGVLTLVPLLVHELLREQTGQTLANRTHLDAELTTRSRDALSRWGLTVEQAGLSTIAPTRRTVRLTQLPARVGERTRLLREQCDAGVEPILATALVAPGSPPRARSAARYHRHHRAARRRPGVARLTVVLPEVATLIVNDVLVQAILTQTFETPKLKWGVRYAYNLQADVPLGGQMVRLATRVILSAGKAATIDFTGSVPYVSVQRLVTPIPPTENASSAQ
jgi:uncharacterized protein (TIGR03000 family)